MENSNKLGKDFMLVVAGQIVSLFGNAILRFSLPLYLLRKTGSSTLFGIVTACSFLPMIALSLLGGILADRVNIVQKKRTGILFNIFCKQIFQTVNTRKTIIFLIIFALIQFGACVLQESYLGNPWYLFILFMPMMILGGGLEEIGWRGIFQTLLEKHFSFLTAALIEGIIWSVWHLPLWLVPNTAQSSMNFIAFTLYCITLGLTLAATYQLTKCIWATILIHAWGNTVLGGMYTLTSLNSFPNIKTLTIYGIQVVVIMLILTFQKRHLKPLQL
jgi:hypothetical protein